MLNKKHQLIHFHWIDLRSNLTAQISRIDADLASLKNASSGTPWICAGSFSFCVGHCFFSITGANSSIGELRMNLTALNARVDLEVNGLKNTSAGMTMFKLIHFLNGQLVSLTLIYIRSYNRNCCQLDIGSLKNRWWCCHFKECYSR